ncbi:MULTISPECIES: YtrH family sporulation protein [Paenibacillus]|uniref:Sporulation protein n=1 Tax=Paenibacillus sambharensis TaxID=1803190 RepID=A0A2W1L6N5_9BACL|nr:MULTISPECIES: YtrH family sporulation protein [Paenibacillus]MCF2943889.1 YtrH family sporulation protein [Paenibacillus tarimensis]PZD94489.1 sporulation protein [Paenibacillus sambharensis]
MNLVLAKAAMDFCIAFGVIIGGSLMAAVGSVLVSGSAATAMYDTAMRLKIWAIVVAIGGTIDPVRVIEYNMQEGHLSPVAQQIMFIGFAFLGAHMGTELIRWICRESL